MISKRATLNHSLQASNLLLAYMDGQAICGYVVGALASYQLSYTTVDCIGRIVPSCTELTCGLFIHE